MSIDSILLYNLVCLTSIFSCFAWPIVSLILWVYGVMKSFIALCLEALSPIIVANGHSVERTIRINKQTVKYIGNIFSNRLLSLGLGFGNACSAIDE